MVFGACLIVSAEKLSDNYKITPYNYHGLDVEVGDETEERILRKDVTNLKKYLKGIILYQTYYPDEYRKLALIGRVMSIEEPTFKEYVDYLKTITNVSITIV